MASGGGLPSPPTKEASLDAPSGYRGGFRQTSCWCPHGTLGTGSVGPTSGTHREDIRLYSSPVGGGKGGQSRTKVQN